MDAQTQISCYFGSDHPMVAKYNQKLVEVYNLLPESNERTAKICAICQRNVEIAQDHYGEHSIYCVRVIYTLYTAELSQPEDSGANAAIKLLSSMTVDGQPIKANQFTYKAVLINVMLALHSRQLTEQAAA